jgi:hypothetical protein
MFMTIVEREMKKKKTILAYFPYFGKKKKLKVGLCDLSAVCLCASAYQFLNDWTNLYETWYLYHNIRHNII